MSLHTPTRPCLLATLALAVASVSARCQGPLPPAPPPRQARWAARPLLGGRVLLAQNRAGLQQWMEQHRNLPPAEQERAFRNDPGFRALSPPEQQRALNQLRRLQGMTPQQRNRSWALLRMTPPQRQQFNAAMQQFTALSPDRRVMVRQAFAALRRVPPPQRQAAMAAYPPLRQFSPYEREVLSNLLFWEPYFTADSNQGR